MRHGRTDAASSGTDHAERVPVDHPEGDEVWNNDARHETATQRLDRNWDSLLQELRVTQTGVQLLTGLLLILPFQPRFASLSDWELATFLAAVFFAVISTVLLAAPIGMHRIMFQQHRIRTLVTTAHHCAFAGVVRLGLTLTLTCVVALTVSVATSADVVGLMAGASAAVLFGWFWLIWPWLLRGKNEPSQ